MSSNKKRILQREERIFLTLSSNLDHALAFFLKNVIAIYEKYNVMFQSEKPKIHKLRKELSNFFAELLARFVKISVITSSECVFNVKFDVFENQKDDEDLVIGSETSQFIKELSESELLQFYSSVRKYYASSCRYIVANFPHDSELLQYAEVVDISKRQENNFTAVRYFVEKYPILLINKDDETSFDAIDALEREFLNFQLTKIPSDILVEERADKQWAILSKEKGHSLGKLKFEKLSRVMLGILTFPHSNAACERIFSLVRRNKTDFRSCLKPKTLEAILVVKSRMTGPCYKQSYDEKFLKQAKSCTYASLG